MKKRIAILLAAAMLLTLAACGAGNGGAAASDEPKSEAAENTTQPESSAEDTTEAAPSEETPETGKVLVAYFSATGHTKTVAEQVRAAADADLYEIVPQEPYTADDLDYNTDGCRANREQNDDSARPAIAGAVDNMDAYDVVLLGYPIWWGQAPKIVCTFLESYDFSGKTIIPFCTSGGSGIDGSLSALQALAPDADWLDGQRFRSGVDAAEVQDWVSGLNIQ